MVAQQARTLQGMSVPLPAHVRRRREQKAFSQRSFQRWAVVVGVGMVGLVAYAGQFASIAKTGYQVDRLRVDLQARQETVASLQAELKATQSPPRVAALATHMGMVWSDQVQYVALAPLPSPARAPLAGSPQPGLMARLPLVSAVLGYHLATGAVAVTPPAFAGSR